MAYKVGIWTSQELADYCDDNHSNKWEAAENVKAHLEEMAYVVGEVLYANVKESTIPAPVERYDESFETQYPCDRTFTVTYDHLLDWWETYGGCEIDDSELEKDSNLLLTSTSSYSGGRAYTGTTPYAHAQTGQKCSNASSTERGGGQWSSWNGIQTALHETGHNTMEYFDPRDDDCGNSGHHETGNYRYHEDGDEWGATPMSSNYQECVRPDNICGNDPDHDETGYRHMIWSSCCMSHWEEK